MALPGAVVDPRSTRPALLSDSEELLRGKAKGLSHGQALQSDGMGTRAGFLPTNLFVICSFGSPRW